MKPPQHGKRPTGRGEENIFALVGKEGPPQKQRERQPLQQKPTQPRVSRHGSARSAVRPMANAGREIMSQGSKEPRQNRLSVPRASDRLHLKDREPKNFVKGNSQLEVKPRKMAEEKHQFSHKN
jgi:hypothetical protein